MSIDPTQLARLQALRNERAVLVTAHQQVTISPDAVILAPVEMSGEDATIHAVAVGRLGQPPTVLTCPDPRNRDEQFALFDALGQLIEQYWGECRRRGTFPQVWVLNGGVSKALQNVHDRMRYTRTHDSIRRTGALMTYLTERFYIDGQQALISTCDALSAHWATGQQPSEDQHLGTVLAWIDPKGQLVHDAVQQAEAVAMGFNTMPEFDRKRLVKPLSQYALARKAGDHMVMATLRVEIHNALREVVCPMYEAIQEAIDHLQALSLPELVVLTTLRRRERDAFADYMNSRDKGWGVSHRDSIKNAAFRMLEREDAQDNLHASTVLDNPVALEGALQSGRAVQGVVSHVHKSGRTHFVTLVSTQPLLRARQRDRLYLATDPRMSVNVESNQRNAGQTQLHLRVVSGQRAVGIPCVGETLILVKGKPDWGRLRFNRAQLSKRTAAMPWTHTTATPPRKRPRSGKPLDPLSELEKLS